MEVRMPTGSLIGALNPLKSKTTIPEHLYLPTYQNQLRLVGRHLDTNGYRSISILDVEGGLLVRAFSAKRHDSELLEFPDDAFGEMVRDGIQGRGRRKRTGKHATIVPTGYEDLLRALGWELDQRLAKAVTLHESHSTIYIAGLNATDHKSGSFSPFDMTLGVNEIQMVLDAAFRRRG